MDWYEFLESVTEGIEDNAVAASVRRELFLHLSFSAEDLQAQGFTIEDARR